MIYYTPDHRNHPEPTFLLSYDQLRDDYRRFVEMSDDEFLTNLLDALHFAAVVAYMKEIPTHYVLNDTGIVHELIHLLRSQQNARERKPKEELQVTTTSLEAIRTQFKEMLALA